MGNSCLSLLSCHHSFIMLTRGGLALLGMANAVRVTSGFFLAAGLSVASRCVLILSAKKTCCRQGDQDIAVSSVVVRGVSNSPDSAPAYANRKRRGKGGRNLMC